MWVLRYVLDYPYGKASDNTVKRAPSAPPTSSRSWVCTHHRASMWVRVWRIELRGFLLLLSLFAFSYGEPCTSDEAQETRLPDVLHSSRWLASLVEGVPN